MRVKRLFSTLRKYFKYVIATIFAAVCAWRTYQPPAPVTNDTCFKGGQLVNCQSSGLLDTIGAILIPAWCTFVVFALVIAICIGIEEEIRMRKGCHPSIHKRR